MLRIRPRYEALRIGGLYLLAGALWIVLSDIALELFVDEIDAQHDYQTWKGIGFVLVSSFLLTFLVQRTLREASDLQSQLRAASDQNLAGLYTIQDGAFVFVNSRVAAMLGYTQAEMVGMTVMDLAAPEDRETVLENVRRRVSGEIEEMRYRISCIRKDGERIRIEVHGRRADWQGRPAVVGVVLDVTRQEITEERERNAERLIALGELTGAVAHDFNNLLTAIIAPIDLSLEKLDPESAEYGEIVEARASAQRAVTLTRQLLSFSRRRIFRARPIALGELVREMSPVLFRLSTGVSIELDLANDLPAVEVDPAHFERVLLNLTSNAVEAVRGRGKIVIRTVLDSSEDPPRVILEVADTGRGMEERVRQRVFEPYFTTREDGTGLGLSTVHGIVNQAGGNITVESTVNVGTTFRISLPASSEPAGLLKDVVKGAEAGAPGQGKTRPAAGSLREKLGGDAEGGVILLVDDEKSVRLVTARALQRYGYQVLPAGTGAEAMAASEAHPGKIDLAIVDIGLPDIDGVALAAQILERRHGISILYTSGHSDERVIGEVARDRISGFLEKPFSVQDLLGAVRAGMEKQRG